MPSRALPPPSAAARPASAASTGAGRRIQTRRSPVHGKGVFALQDIAAGQVLAEYTGERISWQQALARHPHDPLQPQHTFYFHIDDGHVIDAKFGGNCSRWINHSCAPNCQADEHAGRIFITALHNICAGEELSYDYGLVIDARHTPGLKAEYRCRCGSANCRGTLLAPKSGRGQALPAAPARSVVRTADRADSAGRKAGDQADGKTGSTATGTSTGAATGQRIRISGATSGQQGARKPVPKAAHQSLRKTAARAPSGAAAQSECSR